MIEDKDETFLARWLNNELSEEELEAFKASPEYLDYQKIIVGTDSIMPVDFNENEVLERLKKRKQDDNKPARQIHLKLWHYGIAAAVVFLAGVFFFRNPVTAITTSFGEQIAFDLPDGSEVVLNAGSEASFKKKSWNANRLISLNGEALFKVKKGSTFIVKTESGEVTVLGTTFNVKSIDEMLEVVCFEGKVSVSSDSETQLLTKGKAMRIFSNTNVQNWEVSESSPGWTRNESTFKSIPVKFVLDALKKQYEIQFEAVDFEDDVLFTGSFPHNNLDVALKSVMGSLQVEYTIKPNRIVLLKN